MKPEARPHLITKSLIPENQETPINFIKDDLIKNSLFYRRNHFPFPNFTSSFYFLPIQGSVKSPRLAWTMGKLGRLASSRTNLKNTLGFDGITNGRYLKKENL